MKYNWQQSDWGAFTFSMEGLEDVLYSFAEKSGHLKGLLQGLSSDSQQAAIIEIMVAEAMKTSEIENEYLSRNDVVSSIRQNLGLDEPWHEVKDKRAKGMGKLMIEVRKTFDQPLTEGVLHRWHQYLFQHKTKIKIGSWRTHESPMQVISGRLDNPKIHYEAPPSKDVPRQMMRFIKWFNDTAPGGIKPIKHAPIRSAIAHLYFESIHPYEDGNGRIGRAISDKALSQTVGYPLLLSLSATIERNKAEYYSSLEQGQRSNLISSWLDFFIKVILEAQRDTESVIEFSIQKARFFDRCGNKLNDRQKKSVNKMMDQGSAGFEGGMTARKHMNITGASKATATRDLQALEKMGAFIVMGKGRNTRYTLNLPNDNQRLF